MNQDNPQTSANQAQLFVLVRTPVIHVKALWHTIFCNRLTQAVLEIDCIIGKEEFGMHDIRLASSRTEIIGLLLGSIEA